jgi:uncharacterized protein YbgA (DUF1722 family)/uncharacterized protein YbbK (DUF523 family)
MTEKIKIGVSSCLLGNEVRYDGGHKRDRYITDVLGAHMEFVPVCPEVEVGFGVPRETLRLEGDIDAPRLITTQTRVDHTDRMIAWARRRVRELEKESLCGFIFKKGSPSSGMMRVKVYGKKNQPVMKGAGLFARTFMEHFPLLPAEEEGRLHDPTIRENFIERIFTLRRWRDTVQGDRRLGRLVDFHTRHKLLILSHSPKSYQAMGRLVAQGKTRDTKVLFNTYEQLLMEALRLNATVKKNVNVLQHMAGYFKRVLTADEKKEMQALIDQYHQSLVPLIVPVTLINHYMRKYDQAYLKEQVYLNPHPVELKLRNHV